MRKRLLLAVEDGAMMKARRSPHQLLPLGVGERPATSKGERPCVRDPSRRPDLVEGQVVEVVHMQPAYPSGEVHLFVADVIADDRFHDGREEERRC